MPGKKRKAAPLKILLLEDEEVLGKLYFKHLSEAGYIVKLCKDARAALNKADHFKPDLALLDHAIHGGEESGMDVIPFLKEENPNIKVVMLSNYSEFQMAQAARELGADDYLLKIDTSPNQLVDYVKRLFN